MLGAVQATILGSTYNPWWLAGGVSAANVIAVYSPVTANNFNDSLINLSSPGINNATSVNNPTHANGTGWSFSGSSNKSVVAPSGPPSGGSVLMKVVATGVGGGSYGRAWEGSNSIFIPYQNDSPLSLDSQYPSKIQRFSTLAVGAILNRTAYKNKASYGAFGGSGNLSGGTLYLGNRSAGDRELQGSIAWIAIYSTLTESQYFSIVDRAPR